MSQKNFKQRIKYHEDQGCTPEEALQRAQIRELYKKISGKPKKSVRVQSEGPSQEEVRREVEKLKSMGLMTEVPQHREIVSSAQLTSLKKMDGNFAQQTVCQQITSSNNELVFVPSPTQADGWKPADESKVLVVFNPSQPVFVPSPTQTDGWKSADPEYNPLEDEADEMAEDSQELKVDWLRFVVCGIGALITYAALVKFGAEAGGGTNEAWFWTAMAVIPSSILLALPFRRRQLNSWFQKAMGISLIGISYITIHTSIATSEHRVVSESAAGSTEVQQREARIADLEIRLKPIRDAISRLDPVRNRSTITSLREEADDLENDLSEAREALIAAKNGVMTEASAEITKKWSLVEWLRRLMLEPLNILCLHGFLAELRALMPMISRRNKLVQIAA